MYFLLLMGTAHTTIDLNIPCFESTILDIVMSFLSAATPKLAPWKVLLVDDEPDIHDITKLTLSRFRLDGRGLTFLHAYTGEQAKEVLAREKDIALVFLDVVMEREDSGLEVARWMRQELDNQFTRIVLRTGQPGQAPEERVIVDYDINDYKEKTELDRTKLFTTTFAALRAYRDIMKRRAACSTATAKAWSA
jgi:CheY-like chemotaxis protein